MSFVSATKAGGFVASYSHTVPSGVANDDLMILFASANDGDVMTTPTGWTLENRTQNGTGTATWVFSRVASSEPASYTLTWNAAHWHRSQMLVFRGYTGVKDLGVSANEAATTMDLPQLTAAAGDMLVGYGFNWNAVTKSFPDPPTTVLTEEGSGGGVSVYEEQTSSGSTPAYTFTCGGEGRVTTYAVLLEPASAGTAESASVTMSLDTSLDVAGAADATASVESVSASTSFDSSGSASTEADSSSLGISVSFVDVDFVATLVAPEEEVPVLSTYVPMTYVGTTIPELWVDTSLKSPSVQTDLPEIPLVQTDLPSLGIETVVDDPGTETVIGDPGIDTVIRRGS